MKITTEDSGEWFTRVCPRVPGARGRGAIQVAYLADFHEAIALMADNPPGSPPGDPSEDSASLVPPDTVRFDAAELRAQGDAAAAAEALAKALAWYRNRPEPERRRYRADFARTLYEAEQWEEARALFEELAAEEPENVSYLGHLGTLAARRGDVEEAERISRALSTMRRRYLFGAHALWQARIAAQLGDHRRALGHLRKALAQGQPPGIWLHTDPDLAPLRDSRSFRELLAHTG
jgi:tetratricopeptide (TPR) repeat protein